MGYQFLPLLPCFSVFLLLSLLDRHEQATVRPDIHRLRPDEEVVGELLQHMGGPASCAADGKGRREALGGMPTASPLYHTSFSAAPPSTLARGSRTL